ncbi:MAG TPA: dihydroorotate dehydrogenase electron transfer subunit, partial [Thermoplasmataceae archaeon]|nr:dihydroorotate dehydrogenase electron transfer subunit [Thermoplasmataceae archaeon]
MICVAVTGKREETPLVSTLYFEWDQIVKPGQFVMVWLPDVGEIPMSLSITEGTKAITVKEYGPTSKALRNLEPGDRLFFRGPYGDSFTPAEGEVLLVGGGTGMASLRP